MLNDQSLQCDFCFYTFGPFYEVRILPITPIATLSGAATPPHAAIPGARKIVCHHCRYSHYNIEPWTEPEQMPSSFLVPPASANQPLAEEPVVSIAPPVEYDNNQFAHKDCKDCKDCKFVSFLPISFYIKEIYILNQVTSNTIISNKLPSYHSINLSHLSARSPPYLFV